MIKALFRIRYKQFLRGIAGIGLLRIIFLVGLAAFILLILFTQSAYSPQSYYIVIIYLTIIGYIQIKRPDRIFLKINFTNYKLIYLSEYLLLLIPPVLCLTIHLQWTPIIITIFGVGAIVNIDYKPTHRSLNTFIQQLIPFGYFEWKAGIRKTLFIIIALWLIGLSTSFFIGSIPIVIFILGFIPLSFYEKNEPYEMLLAYEMSSSQLLHYKIKMQIKLFSILTVPLIFVYTILHAELWYILIVEFFVLITIQIFYVLLKYAFYEPNSKSAAAQVFGIIASISIILPLFIPIILIISLRFYFKSITKLNFYLNDYN